MFVSAAGNVPELSQPSLSVEEIFGVFPDLIFVLNRDSIITEFHAGNSSDLYVPPEQFLGKSMCDVLPLEASTKIRSALESATQKRAAEVIEYRLVIDDTMKWFEARLSCSQEDRFIMLVRDISESKSKEEHILFQATHDHLTGLYNRAFAFDYINQKLNEAKRQSTTTALLFIDIDDFKKVNDNFGHDVGDRVLVAVAKAINVTVRKQDLVCRLGGDEFVVAISGDMDKKGIIELAEQLNSRLEKVVQGFDHGVNVSLSIGVSSCENGELSVSELVKQADIAMYLNKRHGKGGLSFYKPD